MIETVEGRGVGAGKSYYVTTRILSHLSEGGTVYASSSFALVWDKCAALVAERYGVVIEPEQFVSFNQEDVWRLHEITPPGTDEKPVLIVIDEAHTALNARDWADKAKRPFFNWLTQSRHDNNDLIFISQAAANIDKQVARLVTYVIRIRNMKTYPILGFKVARFLVTRLDQDGRTQIDRRWLSHDRAIFGCYLSKSCGGSHRRLNATIPPRKLQRIQTKKPMIKFVFPVLLCIGSIAAYRLYDKWTSEPESAPAHKVSLSPFPRSAPKPSQPAAPSFPTPKIQYLPEVFSFASDARRIEHRGSPYVRTSSGMYIVGKPSRHGMVVGIDCPSLLIPYAVVRCDSEQGTVFVVAELPDATPSPHAPSTLPVAAF